MTRRRIQGIVLGIVLALGSFGGSGVAQAQGQVYDVRAVIVLGDRSEVYGLEKWSALEDEIKRTKLDKAGIDAATRRLSKMLQDQGYVFSKVTVDEPALSVGFLAFHVDLGAQGNVTVVGNKWYTADQILRNLDWKRGEKFNYRSLYTDLFEFNVQPDVTVHTKLQPRETADGRTVDVLMEVEDSLPVHGSLDLSNTGSESTGDWRLRGSLQHRNLTKNDDILAFDYLTDPQDLGAISTFSLSYLRPLANDLRLQLYGGYSKSNVDDVVEVLDITGEGLYLGAQVTKNLVATGNYNLDLTLGWLYQDLRSKYDILNNQIDDQEITLSMPSITLGYAQKTFDSYGGRNFFSNTVLYNKTDFLGSSTSGEFQDYSGNRSEDGDFLIDRFQYARLQKLPWSIADVGDFSLFIEVDGQLTSNSLITPVQKSIGGVDTVRGYEEREFYGDYGFTTSIELRSPLFRDLLPPLALGLRGDAESTNAWHNQLQGIAFFDAGYVRVNDDIPGLDSSEAIASIGLGVRLALTDHFQMKLDYGIPLQDTQESDSSGKAHLSLRLQF